MLVGIVLIAVMAISVPIGTYMAHTHAPFLYGAISSVFTIEAGSSAAVAVYLSCSMFIASAVIGVVSVLAYFAYKQYKGESHYFEDKWWWRCLFKFISIGIDLTLVSARNVSPRTVDDNNMHFRRSKMRR